jgi:hypothetical protein
MVLRLVLVSMVAGLGVTPPADSEVAGWPRSVQTWLDARLAEWNVAQPVDERDSVSLSVLAADFDAALENALLAAWGDLPGKAKALAVPGPTAVDRAGADVDFEAVVEEMVAEFSEDETAPPASDVRVAAVPPVATNAKAQGESLEEEIVEAELDAGEPIKTVRAPAMATLPAGEDELCEIGDDCALGQLAESSPQTIEPTAQAPRDAAAPAAHAPAAPTLGSPLRDAVRLTRDAVWAWINLLQSPALVAVPQ